MTFRSFVVVGVAALALGHPGGRLAGEGRQKPALDLRASPQVAFSPARIVLTGELRNVTNLDSGFYCPTVVWEWGDGTESTYSADCQPFEPGISEVKMRYIQQHTFDMPGQFRVALRLKKGTQVVLSGSTTVTVRAGGNVYSY
jgi:hypothetical protein